MKIVYWDLKSVNCLVDKYWCVKICDFGLFWIYLGFIYCDDIVVGIFEWIVFEFLWNELVMDKCDVFSLGVIMWEFFILRWFWEGIKFMEVSLVF